MDKKIFAVQTLVGTVNSNEDIFMANSIQALVKKLIKEGYFGDEVPKFDKNWETFDGMTRILEMKFVDKGDDVKTLEYDMGKTKKYSLRFTDGTWEVPVLPREMGMELSYGYDNTGRYIIDIMTKKDINDVISWYEDKLDDISEGVLSFREIC